MLLLLDIGNTHTHLGLANSRRVVKQTNISTADVVARKAGASIARFIGAASISGAAVCSVVPKATPLAQRTLARFVAAAPFELRHTTLSGLGIDYPKPETIGPDRLANALAARHHFGAPSVVVDFGTAVTFDVVDRRGDYVGGIIAPGLAAMTDYLHEKTALLPRIRIREIREAIGKSTEEAMLIGAVHGYRGMIHELLWELKGAMRCRRLPVVATGGYAGLIAAKIPDITAIEPLLTLEGLRLAYTNAQTQTSAP